MTVSEGASLLTFLDAPVLVGDPEGRVIYVNPAFERRFQCEGRRIQGELLAGLFGGGSREAMLRAVADVCRGSGTVRFRVREEAGGFLALVSPITGEGESLGVVILLTDEPLAEERVLAFHREMQEPLEELRVCLEELVEQTGGRRSERYRERVEAGLHALERAQKWSADLHAVLTGRGEEVARGGRLDPVAVVRQVAGRVAPELEGQGARLDLLLPVRLPPARGDASRLESALVRLLRERVAEARPGQTYTLSAREVGTAGARQVVVSLVDPPGEESAGPGEGFVREAVEALGGRLHRTGDATIGCCTLLALASAQSAI